MNKNVNAKLKMAAAADKAAAKAGRAAAAKVAAKVKNNASASVSANVSASASSSMHAPAADDTRAPAHIFDPQIRLFGEINDESFWAFTEGLHKAATDKPITLELSTPGGDADVGKRIAEDVRIARERGHDLWFSGRDSIYSAGVTIMAAFPRDRRFLSRWSVLMIHERQMDKELKLKGPMRASEQELAQVQAQVEMALRVQERSWQSLIKGSNISLDEIGERARCAWYLPAEEALERRLIAGLY